MVVACVLYPTSYQALCQVVFRCAEQVLMATGFVFIGTAGGALLLDETGMQRLAPADVNGVLSP